MDRGDLCQSTVDTNLPKMNYWRMPRMVANYKSYERMAALRLSPQHFMNAWSAADLEAIQEMIEQRYTDTWTGLLAMSEAARECISEIESRRPGWTAAKIFDRFLTLYFVDITNLLKEEDVMDIMFNWIDQLKNTIHDEDAKMHRAQEVRQARSRAQTTTTLRGRQRRVRNEKEYWDEMADFDLERRDLGLPEPGQHHDC